MTRVGYVAIWHDLDALQDVSDLAHDRMSLGLAFPVTDAAFVYRFGSAGYRQPVPDALLRIADEQTPYVAADQLALPPDADYATTTKQTIEQAGRPVEIQVQARDIGQRLVRAFASSLLWPPAQDHRLRASGRAWLHQVSEALSPIMPGKSVTEPKKNQLLEEVTRRFPTAIVLEPRRSSD